MTALLDIANLHLSIGTTPILKGIDLAIRPGEVMGVVGESGSGKSLTALSVMRLLPHAARLDGAIRFASHDILAASEDEMLALRGDDVGMIFQEPMTALNPLKTIGAQVMEGIRFHTGATKDEARDRATAILERVGMPVSRFPLSRYPHELSGGQRQRVIIAIACALKPKLLIADEPTTALDVVLQAQILDLLRELVAEDAMALMLISHDLAVVADMADRITIMRDGEVQEAGETSAILSQMRHPYTRRLAEASMHVPARAKRESTTGSSKPLITVRDVVKDYPGRRTHLFRAPEPFRAVDGVSFDIAEGQTTALVGRSGCGKSTLARLILALDRPTGGAIAFEGTDLATAGDEQMRAARRHMQVVFQDPYGSFNPRHTVRRLVAEPLHLLDSQPSRSELHDRVASALERVGLEADAMRRYPHEFSGGQRQRISIARAIITEPKLIVADEPVSALDVSIRAQVLDLFAELNDRLRIAFLFITHDLHVARAVTDHTLVMDAGQIVERGDSVAILKHPESDAGKALVAASPDLEAAIARRSAALSNQ